MKGTLYGTTFIGGLSGLGTVYSVTTSGTEAVLHSFGASDGYFPKAGLVNVSGTLYGTTYSGGSFDGGTAYSVSTSGTLAVLHNFAGGIDGSSPHAGLLEVKGLLFGTTANGGGTRCRPGCGTLYSLTT
ncbi:MAG TPA: choice-of-anchor tandem repeat GloVer-containing protein, partial [Candidatus Tumulicola sp.]